MKGTSSAFFHMTQDSHRVRRARWRRIERRAFTYACWAGFGAMPAFLLFVLVWTLVHHAPDPLILCPLVR
jgi:hypothetical protein